jgi:tRNA(fMet)-specific endonuclease VapC
VVYILDTDIVSLYIHHQRQQPDLVSKIQSVRADQLCVTMITIEQMWTGALRQINDIRRSYEARLRDCERLRKIMLGVSSFRILPASPESSEIFRRLPAQIKRIGPEDCRIASVARAVESVVVTRNTQHFAPICAEMGIQCEDWTRAAS